MRRCIIHFGLLKTGTTSIQQALFNEATRSGFSYLHLGSPYIGRALMTAFCRPAWRIAPDLKQTVATESASIRDALARSIANSPAGPLVVSCESLSLFTQEELENFLQFLRSQGLAAEGCAYVRDYHSWCESIFQQSCRYGTWKSSLFPLGSGAYRFAIEKFDRLLGSKHVKLWKYDRTQFPEGCVVRDFFQRSGLGNYRAKPPALNQGLGLEACKLLSAYHRSELGAVNDKTTFRANASLASHTERLGGRPIRFHPDIINNRMLSESADLEWVEKRLGESVCARRADEDESQSIKSEDDLIHFSRASLDWLEAESGSPLPKQTTPEQMTKAVAQAMAVLRDKIFSKADASGSSDSCPPDLPKTIWIFWGQGLSSAPPLVRACIDSWRQMNPRWHVCLLDDSTAEPYLRRAKIPWNWLEKLPLEKKSNILRMRLLTEEGGVWTDATNVCLRPLDEWLPDCMAAGFFCFRDPGPDRLVANWFLASVPGNRLACLWRDAHEEFWSRAELLHHSSYDGKNASHLSFLQRSLLRTMHRVFDRNTRYTDFWFHPLVQMLLRTHPYCVMHYLYARGRRLNQEWKILDSKMFYRDAKPLLVAYEGSSQEGNFEEILDHGRKSGLPLLKMNWKSPPAGVG